MKKLLALGLALAFSVAVSNMALADGTACAGKKCKGHHSHKKGSKTDNTAATNGNIAPAK